MARPSKPWFRESKNTWYVTVDGKKVSLGVRGRENKTDAEKAWHRLMANGTAEPPKQPPPTATEAPTPEPDNVTVAEVLTGFLADCVGRMKPNTLRTYRLFLEPFKSEQRAVHLTPVQAEAYARRPEWSQATRSAFLGTLVTAFRWAVRARMLRANPLQGVRMPTKPSRGAKALVSPQEYERLVAAASPTFGAVLRVLWATGCRPSETSAITADNLDAEAGLVRLAEHKTAHKGKSRVLYLTPEVTATLTALAERYPQGPLLRTRHGHAWRDRALEREMRLLRQRVGILHATLYGMRHSFATDALANGVPDAQVAELLGHHGTAMLHKHYSHLGARAQALKDALGKVRGQKEE